jgi:hypothetical protein
MISKKYLVVAALLCCASARAEEVKKEEPKGWWQGITFNAFAAVGYSYNLSNPDNKLNQYRSFDYDHNTFRLDGAELVVQKAAANPGEFGFRLDLTFGAIARGSAARGLFRDVNTGIGLDIDVQQAVVSYIIPVGRGLRLDVGKFVTMAGYELIEGYDGFNDHISRSWLFTYGPFTHTGLKLSYSFHDMFAVAVFLLNGWDNVVDNNAAKSGAIQLSFTPSSKFSAYLTYIVGPERDNNNHDARHLLDLVLIFKPVERLTIAANVDYGLDTNAVELMPDPMIMPDPSLVPRANAQWLMANLYFRVMAHKRVFFNLRGELFYDFDGNRTGTAQRLTGLTFTPEFKITDALTMRAELRYDQSDTHVFDIGPSLRKWQTTAAAQAIYVF